METRVHKTIFAYVRRYRVRACRFACISTDRQCDERRSVWDFERNDFENPIEHEFVESLTNAIRSAMVRTNIFTNLDGRPCAREWFATSRYSFTGITCRTRLSSVHVPPRNLPADWLISKPWRICVRIIIIYVLRSCEKTRSVFDNYTLKTIWYISNRRRQWRLDLYLLHTTNKTQSSSSVLSFVFI